MHADALSCAFHAIRECLDAWFMTSSLAATNGMGWDESLELEVRLVDGVWLPIRGDDVVGDEPDAGLGGEADGEGALDRLGGVEPPDGAPRLLEVVPLVGALLLEGHLHDVAVAGHVLDEQGEVVGVGALLDVECDLGAGWVLAADAAELHVDDAGVAEVVLLAGLGHGAECVAGEVEVVGGDGLVVHVGDVDDDGLVGAGLGLLALDLEAGSAATAVLEDGVVAARRHAAEGRLVDVLVPAGAAVVVGAGALGLAVPGALGFQPLAVVARRDVGAGGHLGGARDAGDEHREDRDGEQGGHRYLLLFCALL